MAKKFQLHQNWRLKPGTSERIPEEINFPAEGIPAKVPGTVHTDLLAAGMIPDPFMDDNELSLQWIGENDWIYETVFNLPPEMDSGDKLYLVCEGLDTIAEIYLNGRRLGAAENMFRCYDFLISNFISEKQNQLQIRFQSPLKYVREQQQRFNIPGISRHHERVHIRKAQYSFGWDWGPAFPAMGIWKPIYIEQRSSARIQSVRFQTLEFKKDSAIVEFRMNLQGNITDASGISLLLQAGGQKLQWESEMGEEHEIQKKIAVSSPKLWQPNGEGEANLYTVTVTLLGRHNDPLDKWQGQVGIRTIELQTESDEKPDFRLLVNGKPLFIKGANWIPADSFIPRIKPEKYRALLQQAKLAGMNMIRVWGGGIYEQDIFYRICDELGLLVWQDYMFACGAYPEHEHFLRNVEAEVRQNLLRLQHHPSVALWCGNNENEWIWFREKSKPVETMPGFQIFHRLIPQMLQELDAGRPYWPSSPFGREADPNAATSGNRHQWDIWSRWVDYTEVVKDHSLFVTEFGFQAPANFRTLKKAIRPSEFYPQSPLFKFHNKQEEGSERLFHFLEGHLPVPNETRDFIYLTQLNQGFALKTCLEYWRFRWPQTAGSIIWQLNDCWPVSSWSLIDSGLQPKLAWYFVKACFSPVIARIVRQGKTLDIEAGNLYQMKLKVGIRLAIYSLSRGELLEEQEYSARISAGGKWSQSLQEPENLNDDQIAVISLYDDRMSLLHRNYYITGRWKHKTMAQPQFKLEIHRNGAGKKRFIQSDKPAYFLEIPHEYAEVQERGFILLPGEQREVGVDDPQNMAADASELDIICLNRF
ncbi:MAG: hypothetical protein WAN36_04415, partial [Calditrichia bacterium]